MGQSTTIIPATTRGAQGYVANKDEVIPAVEVEVGDFVSSTLVTDTIVFEVVAISASGKTITIRRTKTGDVVEREDNGSPYPVVYSEAVSDPNGDTFRLRRNKRGRFGGSGRDGDPTGRSLVKCRRIDGKPVKRVDYSF